MSVHSMGVMALLAWGLLMFMWGLIVANKSPGPLLYVAGVLPLYIFALVLIDKFIVR